MDRPNVTKTRELIGAGFYDDPEVLDILIDRCLEKILSRVYPSAAQAPHARIVSAPSARRGNRRAGQPTARTRSVAKLSGQSAKLLQG